MNVLKIFVLILFVHLVNVLKDNVHHLHKIHVREFNVHKIVFVNLEDVLNNLIHNFVMVLYVFQLKYVKMDSVYQIHHFHQIHVKEFNVNKVKNVNLENVFLMIIYVEINNVLKALNVKMMNVYQIFVLILFVHLVNVLKDNVHHLHKIHVREFNVHKIVFVNLEDVLNNLIHNFVMVLYVFQLKYVKMDSVYQIHHFHQIHVKEFNVNKVKNVNLENVLEKQFKIYVKMLNVLMVNVFQEDVHLL